MDDPSGGALALGPRVRVAEVCGSRLVVSERGAAYTLAVCEEPQGEAPERFYVVNKPGRGRKGGGGGTYTGQSGGRGSTRTVASILHKSLKEWTSPKKLIPAARLSAAHRWSGGTINSNAVNAHALSLLRTWFRSI